MSEPEVQPTAHAARGHRSVLTCVHEVGRAIASPAPGREQEWAMKVAEEVAELREALQDHVETVEAPDNLYEQIEETLSHGATRVQYLRETNRSLMDRLELLEREVGRIARGEGLAFMAVRSSSLQLMGEIRHQQSRETDLVFQAFQQDIGTGD